ncbi:MAG: outer membrane lipoprotein carrier protein LolA [Deltaproteobacteria bacterium]|nr:outer membrane lipoprotein carrier protein LolA [Deltaproteobacteria bacterium]
MRSLACMAMLHLHALLWLSLGSPLSDSTTWLKPVLSAQEPEPARPSWQPDKPEDVLVLVQAYYDGVQDLQAKFEQSYWNPTYGESRKVSGKLKLKQPGKMVWDYSGKQDADFYTDGKRLWMVEHDVKQVVETKVDQSSELSVATQFLFGGDRLTSSFTVKYGSDARVERWGDADHYVLEVSPKQKNSHYKGVVLVVHAATGRVDSFVVYNTDGSSSAFTLSGVKTNRELDDDVFRFDPPRGYVVTRE